MKNQNKSPLHGEILMSLKRFIRGPLETYEYKQHWKISSWTLFFYIRSTHTQFFE